MIDADEIRDASDKILASVNAHDHRPETHAMPGCWICDERWLCTTISALLEEREEREYSHDASMKQTKLLTDDCNRFQNERNTLRQRVQQLEQELASCREQLSDAYGTAQQLLNERDFDERHYQQQVARLRATLTEIYDAMQVGSWPVSLDSWHRLVRVAHAALRETDNQPTR